MTNNYCVIMAGGVGSRFWPLSIPERPKQFLDVLGIGKSLLQMTYERMLHITSNEQVFIVTNENYRDLVIEQLPDLPVQNILTEPARKNTAPCIAYAANKIYALNEDANLLIAPSDHLILKEGKFFKVIKTALECAEKEERLITLGIKPSRPDTGYGYIEFADQGDIVPGQVRKVKNFKEKPDRDLAELFVRAGNFYWNSGIFVWKAKTILNALEKFTPELFHSFNEIKLFYNTAQEQEKIAEIYNHCEDISIDFAVMENARNVDVVLSNFEWSDLGTWGSLNTHLKKDYNGNATFDNKNIHLVQTSDCLIHLPKDKVAIIDNLKGYVIVDDGDKLLILDKKNEQNLKKYLEMLK